MDNEKRIAPFDGRAQWIWSFEGCSERRSDGSPSAYEVRRFRRSFRVERRSERVSLWISADSRYVLYLDGEWLGRGPAHGDVRHQFFDEYTRELSEGAHTLAALVVDYSPVRCDPPHLGAPAAVMCAAGGLLCEVRDEAGGRLCVTDESWRVAVDRARRFQPGKRDWFGAFAGHFEEWVAEAEPEAMRGWEFPDYDDAHWESAAALYPGERREDITDPASPYGLMARITPHEAYWPPLRPKAVFAPGGGEPGPGWSALIEDGAPVRLAPGQTHEVIVELDREWTGFPELAFSGGQGAEIGVGYAEGLRMPVSAEDAVVFGRGCDASDVAIGFSDESTGWSFDRRGRFEGYEDVVRPDGRRGHWTPHHWRAAKFLRLRVSAGEEAVALEGFRFAPCHYMLDTTPFECSDARLGDVHEVSLHTLKLGMHETFQDCPYFEQLQYIGDGALNAQVAMLAGGAYRAVRQMLLHFDWSRVPEGWTQCRYPSRLEAVIPAQSLDWIGAIHAYGLQSGDLETVGEVWPGARVVLDAYRRHTNDAGLPEELPFWNWIDWCPGWKRGVPPGVEAGPVVSHAGKYGIALREGMAIAEWLGDGETFACLQDRYETLRAAARATFWNGRYFCENVRDTGYGSRIGNAYAALAGFAKGEELASLRDALAGDALVDCSYFGYYFVRRALWELGGCDLAAELAPWFHMLDLGLTTWAEDTVFWRSLCHGWSANPVIDLLTRVLGVQARAPGFSEVRVAPAVGAYRSAAGRVMTPRGAIDVAWDRGAGGLTLDLPEGVSGTLALPGASPETPLSSGKHRVPLEAGARV